MKNLSVIIVSSSFAFVACTQKQESVPEQVMRTVPESREVLVTAKDVYVAEDLKTPYTARREGRRVFIESPGYETVLSCHESGVWYNPAAQLHTPAKEAEFMHRVRAEHHERAHKPHPDKPVYKPPFVITFSEVHGPVEGVTGLERAYRALAQARMTRSDRSIENAYRACLKPD